jgi:hypothetical protein
MYVCHFSDLFEFKFKNTVITEQCFVGGPVPRHFSPAFRASGKTFRAGGRGLGKIPGSSGITSNATS